MRALISLGTPVEAEERSYSYKFLADCRKPKLFLSGDRDPFGPHQALEEVVASAAGPKELVFLPGDHFFEGHLKEMRMTIESWLHERATRWPTHLVLHRARVVDRFLDFLASEGSIAGNPLAQLRVVRVELERRHGG